jgi:GGDEF domain-containing protein
VDVVPADEGPTVAGPAWDLGVRPDELEKHRSPGVEERLAHAREAETAAVACHDLGDLVPGAIVTISAGVSLVQPTDDQTSVLGRADLLLDSAKAAGRNRVVSDPAVLDAHV